MVQAQYNDKSSLWQTEERGPERRQSEKELARLVLALKMRKQGHEPRDAGGLWKLVKEEVDSSLESPEGMYS